MLLASLRRACVKTGVVCRMSTHTIDHVKVHNAGGSLEVRIVPMFSDNYGYVIIDKDSRAAALVDPSDHVNMLTAVKRMDDITVSQIWCTHKHDDHCGGNIAFSKAFPGIEIYGPSQEKMGDELGGNFPAQPRSWLDQQQVITTACDDGATFTLGTTSVQVSHVPCHTRGHIIYYAESGDKSTRVLACGDTVFVGGCGRFFEGTAEEMVINMRKIRQLPNDTICLPAHEYTLSNFVFNVTIDPSVNDKVEEYKVMRNNGEFTVPTTIANELKYNLFMNTELDTVQKLTAAASGDKSCVGDAVKTMALLRSMKNNM
jgi:hydroxyacylglutathione hydrolase